MLGTKVLLSLLSLALVVTVTTAVDAYEQSKFENAEQPYYYGGHTAENEGHSHRVVHPIHRIPRPVPRPKVIGQVVVPTTLPPAPTEVIEVKPVPIVTTARPIEWPSRNFRPLTPVPAPAEPEPPKPEPAPTTPTPIAPTTYRVIPTTYQPEVQPTTYLPKPVTTARPVEWPSRNFRPLTPRPIPKPVPITVPVPAPTPAPIPEPVPVTTPKLILVTTPEPIPTTTPELIPEPIPVSTPEPIPEPKPEPLPEKYLDPIPIPQPSPRPEIYTPTPYPDMPTLSDDAEIWIKIPNPTKKPWPSTTPGSLFPSTPRPIPKPIPRPEVPYVRPKPQPIPVPLPQPIPTPVPKPIPLPQPVPIPQPIPKPVPLPQPVPIPQPIPKPVPLPQPLPPPAPIVTPKPIPKPIPLPQPIPTPTIPVPIPQPLPPKPYIPPQPKPEPRPSIKYDFSCAQGDGYYPIARECDKYYECRDRIASEITCPDGLHFNPNAVWPEYPCAYSSEVKCDSGAVIQAAQPTAECPHRFGFFPLNDGDCSRYMMCNDGISTIMNCPAGLVFNTATNSCDWPEQVPQCSPSIFKGFTCPAPPLDENGLPSDFIYKYRYGQSCKQYVACKSGHPRLLSCDAGLSFDEASETCISSDYVKNCENIAY